jgi:hypothetical protein
MDVEFEWEQPLSQMEEGLFPVVEMSMLEVIEVKLRQSDEAAMLTDDERSELDSLLELTADLFALTGPPTPHAEHQIDTGNHAPIAGPPYRVSPAKQRLLRSEVDDLLSEDIIEECESPWASPVVLVNRTVANDSALTTEN